MRSPRTSTSPQYCPLSRDFRENFRFNPKLEYRKDIGQYSMIRLQLVNKPLIVTQREEEIRIGKERTVVLADEGRVSFNDYMHQLVRLYASAESGNTNTVMHGAR